jgi:hypothetical protein
MSNLILYFLDFNFIFLLTLKKYYLNYETFVFRHAGVAQLVEQLICNQLVGGSSPLASSL